MPITEEQKLENLAIARAIRSEQARAAKLEQFAAARAGRTDAQKGIFMPKNAEETIRKAAENGCTTTQIAKALGISRTAWGEWLERYPNIAEAYRQGKAVEHDTLVGALFKAATEGKNIVAAIFLLKARHGYTDTGATLVENRVSINFQLPAALSPAEYVKTITATAEIVPPETAQALAGNPKVRDAMRDDYRRERASNHE